MRVATVLAFPSQSCSSRRNRATALRRSVPARQLDSRLREARAVDFLQDVRRRRVRRARHGLRRPRAAEAPASDPRVGASTCRFSLCRHGRAVGGAQRDPHARQEPPAIVRDLFWWQIVVVDRASARAPLGPAPGPARRVHVGELVVELEETPVDGLRDALARALGDPTLELAFWFRSGALRGRGRPSASFRRTARTGGDADRARRRAARRARPRPVLRDEPELIEAAAAAARLALENARLQAELQAQLDDGEGVAGPDRQRCATRSGAASSATSTTARSSGSSRSRSSSEARRGSWAGGDPEVEELAHVAVDELQVAVGELRELAQRHPPGDPHRGGPRRRARVARRPDAASGRRRRARRSGSRRTSRRPRTSSPARRSRTS